jgi:hypothetical protein
MTSDPPTAAIVLRRAARLLRERGWCQGRLMATDGRLCLLGALDAAAFSFRMYSARAQAHAMVAVSAYLGGQTFAAFNDAKGRTVAQVIAVLEAVADQEDAKDAPLPLDVEQLQAGDDSIEIAEAWAKAYPGASPIEVWQAEDR